MYRYIDTDAPSVILSLISSNFRRFVESGGYSLCGHFLMSNILIRIYLRIDRLQWIQLFT